MKKNIGIFNKRKKNKYYLEFEETLRKKKGLNFVGFDIEGKLVFVNL